MIQKQTTLYFAAGGIIATVLMVLHLHSATPTPTPPIHPPEKPFQSSLAASGIVESLSENIAIGVPVAGLVTEVHVAVSDRVAAGQALFTIDRRELQAQLRIDQANAAVSAANLQRLQDQLARLNSVNDPRAVSQDEVNTKAHDVAVARAELEAARAHVAQREILLQRLTVFAPRAGTILQLNVRPGEYASATPKYAAMVLGNLEHLQVRADVDEQNAGRLQPDQDAIAFLKGDTTRSIPLRFIRIEPYVVPKVSLTGGSTERVDTRVLQVIYAFDCPHDRNIYVGQQMDLFVKTDALVSSTPLVASSSAAAAAKGRL